MKNLIKVFGIIALAAVIGFSMVSCSDDEDEGGGLGGKWYSSQENANLGSEYTYSYWFKDDETVSFSYGAGSYPYTVKGNTLTVKIYGTSWEAEYSISGNTLTITRDNEYKNVSVYPWKEGTFYKAKK